MITEYHRVKFPKGTRCPECRGNLGEKWECDQCGYYRFEDDSWMGLGGWDQEYMDRETQGAWENAVRALEAA